jgi:SM-20-related protein
MHALDLAAFRAAPLTREPFPYLILPGFVRPEARAAIHADYPGIDRPGSFPLRGLRYGPAFRSLVEALEGPEVRGAFQEKFGIDLAGRPTMVTARGRCGPGDGGIHTDSLTKIITVLIYMNPSWEESGGRLRLLRSGDDLDDVITEVPPTEGTLLAFKRADNSWHGHKPFSGPRRAIQFNWVTSEGNRRIAMLRHHLSAPFKRVLGALRPGHAGDRAATRH